MHRLRVAAVVVFAVLLAAQLTLHNHSLIPEGGGAPPFPCSVCAFGADPATLAVPFIAVTLVVAFLLTPRELQAFASAARATRPGRGPPSC
jgi:hypothetical protein